MGKITHNCTHSPEYSVWCDMKHRCSPSSTGRKRRNYYDRGIRVCERWLNSFEYFLEDMGERPSPQHSIDRIDNDGNYEPSNCRWSTASQQLFNRRKPVFHRKKRPYSTADNRYISIEPSGCYRLRMCLPSGYTYSKVFKSYEKAVNMRSQIESERTMFKLLPK